MTEKRAAGPRLMKVEKRHRAQAHHRSYVETIGKGKINNAVSGVECACIGCSMRPSSDIECVSECVCVCVRICLVQNRKYKYTLFTDERMYAEREGRECRHSDENPP